MGPESILIIAFVVIAVSTAVVAHVARVLKREEKETVTGVQGRPSPDAKNVHLLPKAFEKAFDEATRDSGTSFPPRNRPAET